MKLTRIYDPLLKLKGYTMWNVDDNKEMVYFYYRIKTKEGTLRLFLYMFLSEKYSGVEYIVENDDGMIHNLTEIIQPYRDTANEVLFKRERLRQLFK